MVNVDAHQTEVADARERTRERLVLALARLDAVERPGVALAVEADTGEGSIAFGQLDADVFATLVGAVRVKWSDAERTGE